MKTNTMSSECSAPSRMAWLCHGVDAKHLAEFQLLGSHLNNEVLEEHFESLSAKAEPIPMPCAEVQSVTGARMLFHPIVLPVTSRWMKVRIESRRRRECQAMVQKGVDLSRSLGCGLVALGQYTSIVTRNGRAIDSHGMGVTTGNSYAAALAIEGISRALKQRGRREASQTLAVVGAAGNIGRACAEALSPRYDRTILIGSNKQDSLSRLQDVAARLPRTEVANGASGIAEANVVLVSTNSVTAPLHASQFKFEAIVCDVSVPANLDANVDSTRPDLEILTGGIARLPLGEELRIRSFPLPTGHTFGCMAEGMLLSFESIRHDNFTGLLSASHIENIQQLACRHGFQLADREVCKLSSLAKEASANASN